MRGAIWRYVKRSPRIATKRSWLKTSAVTVSAAASGVLDVRQDEVLGYSNDWEAVVDREGGKRVNGVWCRSWLLLLLLLFGGRGGRMAERRQVYLSKNLARVLAAMLIKEL